MNSFEIEIEQLTNLIADLESETGDNVVLDGSYAAFLTHHVAFPERPIQSYINEVGEPNDYDFLSPADPKKVFMRRRFGNYERRQEAHETSSTYVYRGPSESGGSISRKSFDLTMNTKCKFGVLEIFGHKIKVCRHDNLMKKYQESIDNAIGHSCEHGKSATKKDNANVAKYTKLSEIENKVRSENFCPYVDELLKEEETFVKGRGLFGDDD